MGIEWMRDDRLGICMVKSEMCQFFICVCCVNDDFAATFPKSAFVYVFDTDNHFWLMTSATTNIVRWILREVKARKIHPQMSVQVNPTAR